MKQEGIFFPYIYFFLNKHSKALVQRRAFVSTHMENICTKCNLVFTHKEDLDGHMLLHEDGCIDGYRDGILSSGEERRYECQFCRKTYYSKRYLSRHKAKYCKSSSSNKVKEFHSYKPPSKPSVVHKPVLRNVPVTDAQQQPSSWAQHHKQLMVENFCNTMRTDFNLHLNQQHANQYQYNATLSCTAGTTRRDNVNDFFVLEKKSNPMTIRNNYTYN